MGLARSAQQLLMLLLIPAVGLAATRFYLSNSLTSGIAPAFNAGWNVTTGANRYMMKTVKDGSTLASRTTSSGQAAVAKFLMHQWISVPLAAQTLNGTFTGQIRFNQSSTTSTTGQGFGYIRLFKADGTLRTEISTFTTTNLTTTLTNRTCTSGMVDPGIAISAGDRIVVEIGWNYSVGTNTTRTGTGSFGTSPATDLAVDNTTTTANCPWIEFSQTLIFQNEWLGFARTRNSILLTPDNGGGGGGGTDLHDDFATNPSTRWTVAWGNLNYFGDEIQGNPSGLYFVNNTVTSGVTQYAKFVTSSSSTQGGVLFRVTETAGTSGFYNALIFGNHMYVTRGNNTGYLADCGDGGAVGTVTTGAALAFTISGTGASTVVRYWYNPTNNIPVDAANWDSASDPPDASCTLTGGTYYDSGLYVGWGIDGIEATTEWWGGNK